VHKPTLDPHGAVCPGLHTPDVVQVPPMQVWPLAQVTPHPPQLLVSLVVSLQAPLHSCCPDGQVSGQVHGMSVQMPPRQSWFGPQEVPQLPQ
jgi:hypothetical protein